MQERRVLGLGTLGFPLPRGSCRLGEKNRLGLDVGCGWSLLNMEREIELL